MGVEAIQMILEIIFRMANDLIRNRGRKTCKQTV